MFSSFPRICHSDCLKKNTHFFVGSVDGLFLKFSIVKKYESISRTLKLSVFKDLQKKFSTF
ncbi:hypothetical protein EGX98_02815 [Fusobacterium necrophorum]|nr:hypothetical protein EGX98_02815 [Fusobacterium necrophorum]